MFELSEHPRVFCVPPGVDFPRALVDGLLQRQRDKPPEALARVQLIVNTRRMARRIRKLFDAGPPRLLPRIGLVTDLGDKWNLTDIPGPVPPLQRRFEILRLVSALLDQQPDIAPRASLYDLSDSLAALMDEMHGEGVSPDVIDALDVSDQSGHWQRIRAFLGIVRHYFDDRRSIPDVETRQRMVVEQLSARWQTDPPQHPVIVAGSTGSRGATQLLMRAVARLPQGAVVLPGFDTDMPADVWAQLDDAMTGEDHPQYRFAAFMRALDLSPGHVRPWTADRPANPARNRLVSLALRPAPVTDQWLRDGPGLNDIAGATADMTLVEAPSTRLEALTIAMRLRDAAENGETAALITPDRSLSRQVTAALDRWDIVPDDSAGMPLHLSPPGRFLRHVAELFHQPLSAELLLTLLKHPFAHGDAHRGPHLRLTRDLELHLRRHGPPYPQPVDLRRWADHGKDPFAPDWIDWVIDCFAGKLVEGEVALRDHVTRHMALAERIASGATGAGTGGLWAGEAGQEARKTVSDIADNATHGGTMTARDYASLFHAVLSKAQVRNPVEPHPEILIWGTLEARVHGADMLILAGLNEGSWPEAPAPDPWLNRALRHQAGLLLPERNIGLSAHDFQQALLAPEVWITRSVRSDDAETVPSRWLNRLCNLLNGLPEQGGKTALDAMRGRGDSWIRYAQDLEAVTPVASETRPSPRPPLEARPRELPVTRIQTLIRDPYAVYARHVLKLRPIDPLMKVPDALLRGTVVHGILENFIDDTRHDPELLTRAHLMDVADSVLADTVPWAETRALWRARLERVADRFIDGERARRRIAQPAHLEVRGRAELPEHGFSLTAKADRIDVDPDGALHLYDYKTGTAPSQKEQRHFDKQLLLEAAMAMQAGFGELPPSQVRRAVFIGLGGGAMEQEAPLDTDPPEKVWHELQALVSAYMSRQRGYTARRAVRTVKDSGDYDHLARFGEWDITDTPDPQEVG
ncbi:double-strand break repair protein AddB [Roseovarius salis]|uniref:double-strand break repair protein AddB n=1 Tax=Roseovarius salis TaxID=3376063 RepID=UPI0037C85CAC